MYQHDFASSVAAGKPGEAHVRDLLIAMRYDVQKANSREDQKLRIDLWIKHDGGGRTSVQIKMDRQFKKMGGLYPCSIFVELHDGLTNPNGTNRRGWRFRSRAKLFVYYFEGAGSWLLDVKNLPIKQDGLHTTSSNEGARIWYTRGYYLLLREAILNRWARPLTRSEIDKRLAGIS